MRRNISFPIQENESIQTLLRRQKKSINYSEFELFYHETIPFIINETDLELFCDKYQINLFRSEFDFRGSKNEFFGIFYSDGEAKIVYIIKKMPNPKNRYEHRKITAILRDKIILLMENLFSEFELAT